MFKKKSLQNIINKIKNKIKNKLFLIYERYLACYYNFLKWRKVICIDNQYDYVYLLVILRHKLSLIESNWGTSTNHANDYDEKEKLQELINLLDDMIDISLTEQDVTKNTEYQRLSKSFFNKLHRLHDKLWD